MTINESVLRTDSLVLYKIRPARVLALGEKIEIELEGGQIKRVRPKDVVPLHPGPLRSLRELTPCEGQLDEAWELLSGAVAEQPENPGPMVSLGVVAAKLGEREEAEAISSRIARLPDIEDEFNYGLPGPTAIREFLRWDERFSINLGLHFTARYGEEATLIRLAAQLEEARPWRDRKPQICAG